VTRSRLVIVSNRLPLAARVVADRLKTYPFPAPSAKERRTAPSLRFFATDSVEKFRRLGAMFLGHAVEEVQHVDLKE